MSSFPPFVQFQREKDGVFIHPLILTNVDSVPLIIQDRCFLVISRKIAISLDARRTWLEIRRKKGDVSSFH